MFANYVTLKLISTHFTNKMCQITRIVQKKGFFKDPIVRFSKFLCPSVSIGSQLSDYIMKFAIFGHLLSNFCILWPKMALFLQIIQNISQKVKILCRMDEQDFLKPHFGYPMVCTKIWYGYFLSRLTLGLAPSLAAP